MEHLHLPKNTATPGPEEVPYVGTEDYDGGPFLTYPTRQGKSHMLKAASESRWGPNVFVVMPVAELEAFIQTWLFFGLLKELLGEMCNASQFISTADSPATFERRLNTSPLIPMAKNWVNLVLSSDDTRENKQAQYDRIADCLQLTRSMLHAIQYSSRPDFNRQIILSIASVAELFMAAANQAYQIRDLGLQNKCPATWAFLLHSDPESAELMKRHGYCPSEIHRIRNTFMMLSTIHFLTWMDRIDSTASHDHCNDRECLSRLNNIRPNLVKHWLSNCHCHTLTVDMPKVIAILSRGGLPLLSFIRTPLDDGISLEIIEASPSTNFVAISHVWSDGLGNPVSNSLPECQLQHLIDLVQPFTGKNIGEERSSRVLIWLDTLLCPVNPPEARAMAIKQMKKPYTDAAFVLVLDSALYKVDSLGLGPIEKGLLIFTTQWMRRLWTLQEGALADKLYFQFKDKAVDLKQLMDQVLEIHNTDVGRDYLALDVATAYGKLRNFFHGYIEAAGPDLATVEEALQYRSVSVPTDEPLLIAGLLQLDLSYVLNGPESTRMQRLWHLMPLAPKGIPPNIIFRPELRLSEPGFRWAPQTFLAFKNPRNAIGLSIADPEDHRVLLTPAGLETRFAGLHIEMPEVPEGLPRNPWDIFRGSTDNDIFCRYGDGTWFYMKINDLVTNVSTLSFGSNTLRAMLRDRSKRYALILSKPFQFNISDTANTGLLVHYEDEQAKPPIVHSEVPVAIGANLGATGILYEAAWQSAQTLLEDELTGQFTSLGIDDEDQQKEDPTYSTLVASLEQKLLRIAENVGEEGPLYDALQAINQQRNAYRLFQAVIASLYLANNTIYIQPTVSPKKCLSSTIHLDMADYDTLVSMIANHEEAAIFRRFDALNIKNLLYMQAELVHLEAELRQIELDEKASIDPRKIPYPFSVYVCLVDYNNDLLIGVCRQDRALLQYLSLRKVARPASNAISFLQAWLDRPEGGDFFLKGREAWIWDAEKDLLSLDCEQPSKDTLTFLINEVMVPWYHRLWGYKVKPTATPNCDGVWQYDKWKLGLIANVISTLLASLLPSISILILYFLPKPVSRLVVILFFSILFSLILSLVSTSRRIEVFAATTA
ncbi:MAG: hypothetical protein Q9170_004943 [Blastenia crenularia]